MEDCKENTLKLSGNFIDQPKKKYGGEGRL